MEQQVKNYIEDQKAAGEIKKNKGGRPKGLRDCSTNKVTFYLTEEEYALLTEFAKKAWHSYNYSGAARHLVLQKLKERVRKRKREMK